LGPARSRIRSRRAIALAVPVALALLLTLTGVASADLISPQSEGSPNADRIDSLYKLVLAVSVVVFLIVEGTLFYSLFRFRARKGAVAAQIHGNTRLEIGWTVAASVIVVVLAVITFVKLDGIRQPDKSGPAGLDLTNVAQTASEGQRLPPDGKSLNIIVNGQQYAWRYTYPDGDENTVNNPFSYEEMVVPVNTTVTLEILAQDVVHSWWIPELGGKFDAVPGYTNYTWFKIPEPGVYRGQCAELCGRNHANMTARVRAVPPAEYAQWIEQRTADIKAANEGAQQQREALDREQSQSEETQ
jgi:cytochrome c oxidase subunit 2